MLTNLMTEYNHWKESIDPKQKQVFYIKPFTNIRNGLEWASTAWEHLPEQVIRRCFIKNGLLSAPQCALLEQSIERKRNNLEHHSVNELQAMLDDMNINFKEISLQLGVENSRIGLAEEIIGLEDFSILNDIEPTNEKALVERMIRDQQTKAAIEGDDESDVEEFALVSRHGVLTATKTLRPFLDRAATNSASVDSIMELSKLLEKMDALAGSYFNARTVQTKVSSFFHPSTDRT